MWGPLRWARSAGVLLAGVLLVGCSGTGDGVPASSNTSDMSPPAAGASPSGEPTSTTSPDPAASPSVEPAPSPSPVAAVEPRAVQARTTVALDDLEPTQLQLLGEPDELVAGPDAMWTKRANGTVDRIDPETGEVTLSVDVMTAQGGWDRCAGLGVGEAAVWACDGTEVVHLDPATGELTHLGVQKVSDQLVMPVAFERVWVLEGDGSTLLGMSPSGPGQGDLRVPLGTRCVDVAAGPDALWVACPVDDVVLRVDPVAESVDATTAGFTNPRWVAATAAGAFVAFDGGVARLHPTTGAVQDAVAVHVGQLGSIAATDDALWVRTQESFLRRLDPATLEIVQEITADTDVYGSVAVAFGSVWTSAPDDHTIYRLEP